MMLPSRTLDVGFPATGATLSADGLGDVELRTTYRLLKSGGPKSPELQLLAGLTLPTGDTDKNSSLGLRADDPMQPGRGTVDPILGASLLYPFTSRWRAFSTVTARLGIQENSDDYEFGDLLNTTLGASYSRKRVDLFTQLSWVHTERDHRAGQAAASTGGDVLYVTPGIQWWATEKVSFRMQDQILVAHSVNEEQMLAENIVSLLAVVQF